MPERPLIWPSHSGANSWAAAEPQGEKGSRRVGKFPSSARACDARKSARNGFVAGASTIDWPRKRHRSKTLMGYGAMVRL